MRQAVFWNAVYGFWNDGDVKLFHSTLETVFGFWPILYAVFGFWPILDSVCGFRNPYNPPPLFPGLLKCFKIWYQLSKFGYQITQWHIFNHKKVFMAVQSFLQQGNIGMKSVKNKQH